MPYLMVRNQKLTVVVRFRLRASPFDLYSRFVRDFDIRQMSSYDFSDSSHHSASNDMRQAHVLTHSSGVRLPIQYLMKTPPLTSRHEKVTRISALRLGKYSSVGAIETKSTLKPNKNFMFTGHIDRDRTNSAPMEKCVLSLACGTLTYPTECITDHLVKNLCYIQF